MNALTDAQLLRLYRRAYDRMSRLFEGGRQYGIDWPTLRACEPSWHHTLTMIVREIQARRI